MGAFQARLNAPFIVRGLARALADSHYPGGVVTNGLLLYLTGGTEGTGPLRKLTDGAGTNTGIHESGRAKQLDGVADHGDTNNTFLSVYQSAFTWCGRVKMDDGNPTAIENFWGVADSDNGNVTVRVSTAGALQAGASDTVGLGYGEFAGFFSNGAQPWVDVVVALVQNGADIDVSAYKDGVFVSTQTISGKTLADITITTNSFIGADTAGGGTDFYAGGIADVRLYSKALSAAEALQFTDEPEHVIDPTTIEAWYKMDGYRTNPAVNDPIIDYSGKGRHGFWANGGTALTAQTEPLPQVILQSSNQRALFDGSSDSATVSASANIQDIFDGGGTIVAWLYPVSEGEPGRICDKKGSPISGGYSLNTRTGTPPTFGIRLTQEFSTTDGKWDTTSEDVTNGVLHCVIWKYDSDAVGNDPTLYLNGTKKTVGSGLTENTTPVGTRLSDSGLDLIIGDSEAAASHFDGPILELAFISGEVSDATAALIYASGTPPDLSDIITLGSGNRVSYWRNTGDGTWPDLWASDDATVNGSPPVILVTEGKTAGKDGFGFNLVAVRGAENALVGAGAEQINLNAHIGDFSALTVGTIEFWFRARAGSMERAILSAADKTDANSSLVVFFDASPNDGELTFLIWEAGVGSLKFASGTTTLNDGSWHRASITMDVSGSTLYIDNADDSPVYSIGTASTQKWFNSVNDLDVMAALFLDASSPLYWADNLEVDDLLIYNRALTDVERTENYNAELAAHS